MELLTLPQAADRLGTTRPVVRKLIDSNLLRHHTAGAQILLEEEQILAFEKRQDVNEETTPPAVVVRLGAPLQVIDDDLRCWSGWNEAWDEETKRNAVRMWWKVDPQKEGYALVALVGHIVVDLWNIRSGETSRGFTVFDLDEPTSRQEAAFSEKLWRLGPGPSIFVKGQGAQHSHF